jgi:dihydroorotate dehydrogenase
MKPWLWIPPKLAHDWGSVGLRVFSKFSPQRENRWKHLSWRHLKFPNPLGVAGGVDKNAKQILAWQHLGAGFIEVGTVTPLPQLANQGSVIARDIASQTLWNRLGFPNDGADIVLKRLRDLKSRRVPLFINVGKNRTTALEDAHKDYSKLLLQFQDVADVFVVNISSPNTEGLRDLLKPQNLNAFLKQIFATRCPKPILLKLSPDMSEMEMESLIEASLECGIAGWILTNTTLKRWAGCPYPSEGGVSGQFLKSHSVDCLRTFLKILGDRKGDRLVVSVGGVMTADDVNERLLMGADLVQAYTALVFEGPGFFDQVRRAQRHDRPHTSS